MQRNFGAAREACTPMVTLVAAALVWMGVALALRLYLAGQSADELAALFPAQLRLILGMGARLDAVPLAYLCLPAALVAFIPGRAAARLVAGYASVLVVAGVLVHASDLLFYRYYGSRLNYLVLEHGGDTEVWSAILREHVDAFWLAGTAATLWIALFLHRRLARALSSIPERAGVGTGAGYLLRIACVAGLALAARGTLDHRPLNPSAAAVTSNRVANEITASGAFSLAYESSLTLQGISPSLESVVDLPASRDELRARAAHIAARRGQLTKDSANPLVHQVSTPASGERPLNVVVVVMESFTGRLVGALGGRPALSPEFDAIAREGLLLTHCYATGERTVQGLEAVLSSFPPLPGVAAVRRAESAKGFATLASVLGGQRGYDSVFLYGGQAIFDHMRGFFLNNGYRTLIEEADFRDPRFRGTWGVSDEDLFHRANLEAQARWEAGQPFLATILTVSLHTPWEFPKDRAPRLPPGTVVPRGFEREELENFLYADFAVGEFIREARRLPYFRDTLFVFVGDHGVHLQGHEIVPSEEYRVPALFLAPERLAPGRIDTVTSQLDLGPTILGLVGGSFRSPFFGRDVRSVEEADGFAPLIYKKSVYGVRRADRLTVVGEDGPGETYRIGASGPARAVPASAAHAGDERDLLAILSVADEMLREQRYTDAPAPRDLRQARRATR